MAGRREFELLFRLQASLGGNFNNSFRSATGAVSALQDSLNGINRQQNNIASYQRQNTALENNRQRLEELTEEHERLQREMSQTEEPSEALRRSYERNASQIQQATDSIERQQGALENLRGELEDAGIDTNNLTEENLRLSEAYRQAQRNQERLADTVAAQRRNSEAISKTKSQIMGTAGAIAATGAAFAIPVQKAMEYQSSLAKVSTIADESAVSSDKMSRGILKVSSALGVNANAVAEDVYNAISAGQKTEDALNFVKQSTLLAKGGFASTAQSLDVLTSTLNAYGMSSEKAAVVSDMLINTQNKGKIEVGQLAEVMGKIIPTARANNVALEQVCAGYATVTSKGVKAAEATTYMNSMMNELGKSGSKTDKALRKGAGKSFSDLMAEGKSLAEVLEIVKGEAEKSGLKLNDMFGSAEAGKAAAILMQDGVDGFNASVKDMVNSTGAAQAAFDKMNDTPEAKMERAKESMNNLAIVIGTTFLPYIGKAADKLAELVGKFGDWAAENPKLLDTIFKVAAGLAAFRMGGLLTKLAFLEIKGVVLGGIGVFQKFQAGLIKLPRIMGVVTGAFSGIGRAISALRGGTSILGIFSGLGGIAAKLIPVVGIIALIGGAIYFVITHLKEIKEYIKNAFGGDTATVFGKLIEIVKNVGKIIKEIFSGEIGNAKKIIEETFGPAGLAVFDMVVTVIETVKMAFEALMAVIEFAMPYIQVAASIFTSVFGAALQGIADVISSVMGIFQGLINFITGVFTGNWGQAWEGIKGIFKGIFDSLVGLVKLPINAVIAIINGAVKGINKVGFEVPNWVPVLGGKAFKVNIPKIEMLAKGSKRTPDTFIAGEKGAELITGAKNRTVFTAAQTGSIFKNINAAKAQMDLGEVPDGRGLNRIEPPTAYPVGTGIVKSSVVSVSAAPTKSVIIYSQPQIYIDGNRPDDLNEKLKKHNEQLLEAFENQLKKKESDERRSRYD